MAELSYHRHCTRIAAGVLLLAGITAGIQAQRVLFLPPKIRLQLEPAKLELDGPRAAVQVIATQLFADGHVCDASATAHYSVDNDTVGIEPGGFVTARHDGTATITVETNGMKAVVPMTVRGAGNATTVSFRHEVIAALSVAGCNQGACHGTPAGKNGFALSLRGGDPAADYRKLTRDLFGRRTTSVDPDSSLILRKGRGTEPHEGGVRWQPSSLPLALVRDWLAAGCPDDPPTLPSVTGLEITPGQRTLRFPDCVQQLAVRARFSDGRSHDVTRLTVFSSSDPTVAAVGDTGRVQFDHPGEVAILVRYLDAMKVVQLECWENRPDFRWPNPPAANEIDRLIFAKLRRLQMAPAELCTDAEFLRRASLDITGALPPVADVRAFLSDPSPNKRERAIDRLLESPGFADFWALKWSDVLRSSRKTMNSKGAQALHDWLRANLAANTPMDEIVRRLLTASGSSAVNPAANFYRVVHTPAAQAEAVAQLFCGVRLQCAKCHNHPFEHWTTDDYAGMAAFFARVRTRRDAGFAAPAKDAPSDAEIVYLDRSGEVTNPRNGAAVHPRPLGGVPLEGPGDRRAEFAEWLTRLDNPFFARSLVNRVWFHLVGRGIVEPVDDFRDSNPPAHPELLDYLAKDFVAHHYDLRRLIRTIANSRTYQLSERGGRGSDAAAAKYFARAESRLLTAEQLLDAISDVTGVAERFAGLPPGARAVQLPDVEAHHPFLKAFGKPARELPCECERDDESNLAQALQLVSGSTVQDKLKEPNNRIGVLLSRKAAEGEILEELWLAAYGRMPTDEEKEAAHTHLAKAGDPRRGMEDLFWAVLNSPEFLFRH